MSRPRLLLLALCSALTVPSLAAADDLPPAVAPPYSGVFHMTSRSREKAQDDWTYTVEDTVTIAVTKTKQSRWDYKSDGHTLLYDQVGRYSTLFGGKTRPPNTATRSQSPFTPIAWEFGYDTVQKATDSKPKVLGKTTIAGNECMQLRLTSEQYGEPEFCVTKTGIVLRFANKSSTAEIVYEAQSIDESAPDDKLFSVPAGTTVEERAGTAKKPKIM